VREQFSCIVYAEDAPGGARMGRRIFWRPALSQHSGVAKPKFPTSATHLYLSPACSIDGAP
jgi:hypothetical protein